MSTAPSTNPPLLTAEEFAARPDPGYPEELVRGRIEVSPLPNARHGQVCNRVGRLLGNLAEEHELGHVLNNDAGVVTERGPDSVRGPDVAFYSYGKLPRGRLPSTYPDVVPDAVFEVLSPSDRWPRITKKVAEYLNVGIAFVAVLDPERDTISIYSADDPVRTLSEADDLILPASFGHLRIAVRSFFE
jgi:Uma2 family endonuclease